MGARPTDSQTRPQQRAHRAERDRTAGNSPTAESNPRPLEASPPARAAIHGNAVLLRKQPPSTGAPDRESPATDCGGPGGGSALAYGRTAQLRERVPPAGVGDRSRTGNERRSSYGETPTTGAGPKHRSALGCRDPATEADPPTIQPRERGPTAGEGSGRIESGCGRKVRQQEEVRQRKQVRQQEEVRQREEGPTTEAGVRLREKGPATGGRPNYGSRGSGGEALRAGVGFGPPKIKKKRFQTGASVKPR